MQMVKARTMPIFAYDKRTIESFLLMTKGQLNRYCFEQKRPGTDGVALATIFST